MKTNLLKGYGLNQRLAVALATVSLFFAACQKNESITGQTFDGKSNNLMGVSSSASLLSTAPIPASTNNKVAYYTFDATPTGTPKVQLGLLNFAKEANIVIIFEGAAWELADTAHYTYAGSPMISNYYKNYRSIINDIKTLQSRGVKVLMNVDDRPSWNTTTPFTTYNNQNQNIQQFAAFVNDCVTTKLGMDGIVLDVEHLGFTAANSNYTTLLTEFGKYFGPKSSRPTTSIYTAAIYDGAQAGFAIGQSPTIASYMNFVMDQGYFEDNTARFTRWASFIGNGKTMVGLVKDYNSQSNGISAAQYQPAGAKKAGIMVYAANVDSAYSNNIFRALR